MIGTRHRFFVIFSLVLLVWFGLCGCDDIRIVDLNKEIRAYLASSRILEKTLAENNLVGYEYSNYRKGGLSVQAFLRKENHKSYLIVDLHRMGGAEYRLRMIRYIEGSARTSDFEQKILYAEEQKEGTGQP